MNRIQFNRYIADANFRILFNELGWDNASSQHNFIIRIDEVEYEMKAVSQKRGFIVYTCVVDEIPQNALSRKIDMRLRRYSNDYIVIFTLHNTQHHLWIAPVKTVEKRDLVTIEYAEANQADFLFSKLGSISFELDETPTIVDVTARVHEAFEVNAGKITKDFYAGFKKQHNSFAKFIQGVEVEGDKQWYASVMLNRLMFCYFIQKKGFLNFDVNYLHNKLVWTKEQQQEGTFFHSFYKGFLRALFHGGLNNPQHNQEFEKVYGRIPYLNGGMFDEHQLEKQYEGIDIDDKAFEDLFDFFDKWRWHLDTRITATGKDINPDVLGYIFEQYINDRAQMGAYYTKEDITEYISKNCIIPFLMDEVAKTTSAKEFKPDGFVWKLLQKSGDKYIYPAVSKGCDKLLPDYIEQGIDTTVPNLLERRARWNERTHEELALPTEIWRETVERRTRYFDIKNKIAAGEIQHINDFITYNLDIRQFTYDVLDKTTDHLFIKHFYAALQRVTILDPTCGSGAFLFAALNILEPLYEVCIDRMTKFNKDNPHLFVDELAEISNKYRSNIQYFIYKSIILRNLYGVDIMVEATEIAKLRLFLKMVAVVDVDKRADNLGLDPLPDIDFNIRCGNTLVGYATQKELERDLVNGDMFAIADLRANIELEMQKVALAYERFKEIQLTQQDDIVAFKQAKNALQDRLTALNEIMNRLLYGANKSESYDAWLTSHQPFHWLSEFYQIIEGNGGFDVIIGNPPYVEYTKKDKKTKKSISEIYQLENYLTIRCNNLYAFTIERSISIVKNNNIGFIVPLTIASNNNMQILRDYICRLGTAYFSHYEIRPAKLFEGVEQRLTIFIIKETSRTSLYSTAIIRWKAENRFLLFKVLNYAESFNDRSIWRLSTGIENSIYKKFSLHRPSSNYLSLTFNSENKICYRTAGVRYWIMFLLKGFNSDSLSNKENSFIEKDMAPYFMCAFNSNLFWWYYSTNFDMFNLKDYMIFNFKLDYTPDTKLCSLSEVIEADLDNNKTELITNSVTRGVVSSFVYKKKKSKLIIDEIDKVLAQHYGFTDEELDFIINYDIKYRMGSELDGDNE